MSLTTTVTVHCDNCGRWEHTEDRSAAQRRAAGWHRCEGGAGRRDFCPRCGCTVCGSMPFGDQGKRRPGYRGPASAGGQQP